MALPAAVTAGAKNKAVPVLLICFVGLVWAAMEAVIQFIPREYTLYQVIWVRYVTHILFLLLVFGPRYGTKLARTRQSGRQWVRALMMFVMPVSFIVAVNTMPAKNILAIFWLSPLVILILARFLSGERANKWSWIIAFVGFTAVLLLLRPNQNLTIRGIVLAVLMNVSFSLYFVWTRKLRGEQTVTNLFYTAVGVLIPLSLGLPFFWRPLTWTSGLLMVIVGLLGFLLLWVLDKALEMTTVSTLAPFVFAQPLWTIVLAFLIGFLTN